MPAARPPASSRSTCSKAGREFNLFRWQFFRVHFQFVMANERPHAYDFFMIVCGPVALCERMAHPAAALAVVTTPDGAERELAWSALAVSGPTRMSTAPDLGTAKEQPARRRG